MFEVCWYILLIISKCIRIYVLLPYDIIIDLKEKDNHAHASYINKIVYLSTWQDILILFSINEPN